jgi:hypothetical protein
MDTIKHNTRLQTRIALSTSKDNNHDQVVVNADSSTKKLKDRLSIASYGTIKPNYATTNVGINNKTPTSTGYGRLASALTPPYGSPLAMNHVVPGTSASRNPVVTHETTIMTPSPLVVPGSLRKDMSPSQTGSLRRVPFNGMPEYVSGISGMPEYVSGISPRIGESHPRLTPRVLESTSRISPKVLESTS